MVNSNQNIKPLVIYIMSDRRSGSTLLENVLSKSSDIVSVGEIAMLKGHINRTGGGFRWDWNCSCGLPVLKCPFWTDVLNNKKYFESYQVPETKVKWKTRPLALALVGVFPFLLKPFSPILNKSSAASKTTLNKLYNSVTEISGKNILIDSSKDPDQFLGLYKSNRDFDMKLIWLKKDLRSIASSKSKWRVKNKQQKISLFLLVIIAWFYKRICKAVARSVNENDLIELNYEDLAVNTQNELNKITQKFGLTSFAAPANFEVKGEHTIAGTPMRFTSRPIKIDNAWKEDFKKAKLAYSLGGILNK